MQRASGSAAKARKKAADAIADREEHELQIAIDRDWRLAPRLWPDGKRQWHGERGLRLVLPDPWSERYVVRYLNDPPFHFYFLDVDGSASERVTDLSCAWRAGHSPEQQQRLATQTRKAA